MFTSFSWLGKESRNQLTTLIVDVYKKKKTLLGIYKRKEKSKNFLFFSYKQIPMNFLAFVTLQETIKLAAYLRTPSCSV